MSEQGTTQSDTPPAAPAAPPAAPPASPPVAPPQQPRYAQPQDNVFTQLSETLQGLPEKVALAVREAMPSAPTPPPAAPKDKTTTDTPAAVTPPKTEKTPGAPPNGVSRFAHWWFS